jgi:excisionase family DNA binding protein
MKVLARGMSVGEVADALKVHRVTVWRWIRDRKIRAVRVGDGNWRIDADDLARLVTTSEAVAR